MASTFDRIRAELKKFPDSAEKRKVLTELNGLEEQLNAFHFGLSGTLGYRYCEDNIGANAEKRVCKGD